MMNCDKAKEFLSDYIEGVLEPDTKKEVDTFLETNEECKKIFQEAASIREAMEKLSRISTSEDFDVNLRNKIIAYNNGEIKEPVIRRKRFSVAFSGAVLMVALYFYVFTDVGVQFDTNESILPSSTISAPQKVKDDVDSNNQQMANEEEDVNQDSTKNAPENINNSNIHLTGKQE